MLLQVPDETMTTELDSLKEEMHHLRIHNSQLEEKIALLSQEKEDLMSQRHALIEENIEKDREIANKASNLAKKSEDYKLLLEKMQQVENQRNEAQKQAEELQKLLKTQVHWFCVITMCDREANSNLHKSINTCMYSLINACMHTSIIYAKSTHAQSALCSKQSACLTKPICE